MQFFNSPLFWFIEGILFAIAITAFKLWAEDRRIPMPLWKWVLLIVWMLLVGFTLAFVGTSLGEREVTAAVKGGILFGIVSAISGVVVWRLLLIGRQSGSSDAPTEA